LTVLTTWGGITDKRSRTDLERKETLIWDIISLGFLIPMERNHSQLEWGPTTAEGERVNCWLPPRFHHVSISNLTSTEIGDYSNTIHSNHFMICVSFGPVASSR
jgi:hypothetical protein